MLVDLVIFPPVVGLEEVKGLVLALETEVSGLSCVDATRGDVFCDLYVVQSMVGVDSEVERNISVVVLCVDMIQVLIMLLVLLLVVTMIKYAQCTVSSLIIFIR